MKKTTFIFLILTIFSCESDIHVKYQVENATSKNLKILAFYDSQMMDSIEIQPGDIFEKNTEIAGKNADTYIFDSSKNGGIRDSIVLISDNHYYKVQFCEKKRDISSCENIENKLGLGYFFPQTSNEIKKGLFKKSYKFPFKATFTNSYFFDAQIIK
ncbi:MAG: hypothetical protein CFE22_17965 [Cytophagaceae bacterium BCCC1]|nr:MAG: hypothetical protein CFE22_17965 [Cytophagaceae bacterium BCCC1]